MTSYVAMRFNTLPDVLLDHFHVSTRVDDSIMAKRAYRALSHKVTHFDFVDFNMLYFDVIIGMDWLHTC